MVTEHRYLPAWTLMAVNPSLVQFPPVPLQTRSLSISLSIQRRAQSQTFYDEGSDVRILTPTESCRCQERVGLSQEKWTPHFWFPPVQMYRNIWTPRIIYFNFTEIFGPPGTKVSEIFGPS